MIKKSKVIMKISKHTSMHFVGHYPNPNKIDTCNINIYDKQSTYKLL